MNIYFVKFNNYSIKEGTAQLHYAVLKKHKRVLWGQWSNGKQLLSEAKYNEMNADEFWFYALDRTEALLKMRVSKVLRREEVIEQKLTHLVPEYYGMEQSCSAYYLVEEIIVEPVSYAKNVVSKSGKSVLASGSLNSAAPWLISDLNTEETLKGAVAPVLNKTIEEDGSVYCVYRYKNSISGKSYIGQTNNITRRRKEHENPISWKNSKKYLYTIFAIQGLDTMEFSILYDNLSKEEADFFEAKEIEIHNSYYPNGLNERNESRHLPKEQSLIEANPNLISKLFNRIKMETGKPE